MENRKSPLWMGKLASLLRGHFKWQTVTNYQRVVDCQFYFIGCRNSVCQPPSKSSHQSTKSEGIYHGVSSYSYGFSYGYPMIVLWIFPMFIWFAYGSPMVSYGFLRTFMLYPRCVEFHNSQKAQKWLRIAQEFGIKHKKSLRKLAK